MDERLPDPAPCPSDLPDSEQRLLDHIRAGLVDAEIAVRLGISNAEVKSRIERLASKLGVEGREGLRLPASAQRDVGEAAGAVADLTSPRRIWPTALLPAAILAGLAIAFVAGLLVASRDDEPSGVVAADATSTISPTPASSTTPSPDATPRIDVIDGRAMEYAGQLFSVPGQGIAPVFAVSSREEKLGVTLSGIGLIRFGFTWSSYSGTPFSLSIRGNLRDRTVSLLTTPGDGETNFIPGDQDSASIFTRSASGRPVIVLSASDAQGNRYHLDMNLAGEIFVATEGIPRTAVLDQWTGEQLDVSLARSFWQLDVLAGGFFFNTCYDGPCSLVVSSPSFEAPTSGEVTCPTPEMLIYRTESIVLTFERAGSGLGPHLTCLTSQYGFKGSFVPGGHYVVTAATLEGQPLSIAADSFGTVYVGEFRGTVGCPCRQGS